MKILNFHIPYLTLTFSLLRRIILSRVWTFSLGSEAPWDYGWAGQCCHLETPLWRHSEHLQVSNCLNKSAAYKNHITLICKIHRIMIWWYDWKWSHGNVNKMKCNLNCTMMLVTLLFFLHCLLKSVPIVLALRNKNRASPINL